MAEGWAGQRLVEMVVRVDKPWQHDMPGGVERRADALGRLASSHTLDDLCPLDDDATLRVVGKDRQRILDPKPHRAPRASDSPAAAIGMGRPGACQPEPRLIRLKQE